MSSAALFLMRARKVSSLTFHYYEIIYQKGD